MSTILAALLLVLPSMRDTHFVRIVDAETGSPVPGASLRWALAGELRINAAQSAEIIGESDAEGYVGCSAGSTGLVRVLAEGYAEAVYSRAVAREGRSSAVTIELARPARLRICAVDQGGSPIAGIRVRLKAAGYARVQRSPVTHFIADVDLSGRTDAAGCIEFEEFPPTLPFDVTLITEDASGRWTHHRAERGLVLKPHEHGRRTYLLGGSNTIQGRLVAPDGAPVSGKSVRLVGAGLGRPQLFAKPGARGRLVTTDAEGHFAFDDVPTGDWWLGLDPAIGTGPALPVTVDARTPTKPVELAFQIPGSVQGRVLSATPGAGVPAYLTLVPKHPASPFLTTRADASGFYQFVNLPPDAYRVIASANGHGRGEAEAFTGDAGVVVQLLPQGRICGRIVDGQGKPFRAPVFDVLGPSMLSSSSDDGDSGFEYEELKPGTYSIRATAGDGRVGIVTGLEIAEGGQLEDLEVRMAPGGTVLVTWEGRDRYGRVTCQVDGRLAGSCSVHRGTTWTYALPPGEVRVVLRADGEVFASELGLEAGQEIKLAYPDSR